MLPLCTNVRSKQLPLFPVQTCHQYKVTPLVKCITLLHTSSNSAGCDDYRGRGSSTCTKTTFTVSLRYSYHVHTIRIVHHTFILLLTSSNCAGCDDYRGRGSRTCTNKIMYPVSLRCSYNSNVHAYSCVLAHDMASTTVTF